MKTWRLKLVRPGHPHLSLQTAAVRYAGSATAPPAGWLSAMRPMRRRRNAVTCSPTLRAQCSIWPGTMPLPAKRSRASLCQLALIGVFGLPPPFRRARPSSTMAPRDLGHVFLLDAVAVLAQLAQHAPVLAEHDQAAGHGFQRHRRRQLGQVALQEARAALCREQRLRCRESSAALPCRPAGLCSRMVTGCGSSAVAPGQQATLLRRQSRAWPGRRRPRRRR
jgi:hypothetical protein